MRIDITKCEKSNVIDSCALWNVISSKIFHSVLEEHLFTFCCTDFVIYECLHRVRTNVTAEDEQIKSQVKILMLKKKISSYPLTIEDLQDEQILEYRKKLGRGELSSITFAKKTGLCFLTDDQQARNIAEKILGKEQLQTTPLLLGWLFYNGYLSDSDLEPIIEEHKAFKRPLERYFREVHEESWRIKSLLSNSSN